MNKPTISIVGTGYVGLSTATIFANAGFKVYTIDIDQEKIDIINSGKSYFYELGLDKMIQNGLKTGNLTATTSYEESIPNSDIIFSCVGTPDNEDGSPNLDYIYAAAKSVVENVTKPFIYVQKSTVPVGTGKKLTEYMKGIDSKIQFDYVSNPEFLREGAAVYDTLNMDRVVVGNDKKEVLDTVLEIYKAVDELAQNTDLSDIGKYATDNNPATKKFSEKPFEERVVRTSLESAELIKISANAFLALKISYANEIALLCDKTGADITEVMKGIGMDHRIGRAFLFAGRGYGGGCFPKDVSGLITTADEHNVDMAIMKAATARNDSMPEYILDKINNIKGKKITVLGLAFKTGTSDTRKSPGIKIANLAIKKGATVVVTDPEAIEEAKHTLDKDIIIIEDSLEAIKDADVVILTTPWKRFLDIPLDKYIKLMKGNVFIDAVNSMNPKDIKEKGLEYFGVGRS